MKCVACNRELTKKELLYTEDKELVCVNPFDCKSPAHPNSVENILARGGAVKLFNEVELEENVFDKLNIPDEMKDRIMKVATKPQSIRLSNLEIAYYIIALQEERPDLSSMSEAVRHCIQVAMEVEPLGNYESVPKPVIDPQIPLDEPEKPAGLTGIVVPDIPKSVNVDWNNLPPVEKEPVKEEEEEEELTF